MYCSMYCAVVLATCVYCLVTQLQETQTLDANIVAVIALSGLFGLFTFMMTVTSWRFICINVTNIDMLRKPWVYQLAVRVPNGTHAAEKFGVVVYPLPLPPGHATGASQEPVSARDQQATRTFAILSTNMGENPWDLGIRRNWKSVMGNNLVDWLLPIRHSPCTNHESMVSDYEFGPLVAELKKRYQISEHEERVVGIEMNTIGR
jgi:palmitoyltransferase